MEELNNREIVSLAIECLKNITIDQANVSLMEIDIEPKEIPKANETLTYFINLIEHLLFRNKLKNWLQKLDQDLVFVKKWTKQMNGKLVVIAISGELQNFGEEQQRQITKDVSRKLDVQMQEIAIIGIVPGSIQLVIDIHQEKAKQLLSLFKEGLLKEHFIENIELVYEKEKSTENRKEQKSAFWQRNNQKIFQLVAFLLVILLLGALLQVTLLQMTFLLGVFMLGVHLQGARQKRAYLPGSHLHEVDLRQAYLRGAYLQKVYLRGADLRKANLREAYLQETNLEFANLREANLQQANLQKANLELAYLQKAHLRKAYLKEANLRGANLEFANLQKADLKKANLQKAYLQKANLQGANLQEADLQEANLQGVNLRGAFLPGTFLQNTRNLTPNQIAQCKNIDFIKGLSDDFLRKVKKINPKLMKWWKDPE